jgi:hypothetical protein
MKWHTNYVTLGALIVTRDLCQNDSIFGESTSKQEARRDCDSQGKKGLVTNQHYSSEDWMDTFNFFIDGNPE